MGLRREKIEHRLRQMGKNPAWLAKQLGRSKQSIYQWLDGASPRDEQVWETISQLLDVQTGILLDDAIPLSAISSSDEVEMAAARQLPKGLAGFARGDSVLLPVWRGVAAGLKEECYFVSPDSLEFLEVPAFLVGRDPDRNIVCIAAGTSMSPRIRQGDRAIVRLDPNPPRNSLVVVQNPEKRRFIKALRETKQLELHSINEAFPPIIDLAGWELLGCVIAVWAEYEAGSANIEWDGGRPLKV